MAANAYIVCKSGVEWNEIVAVYLDEDEANTACERHELRRRGSKDVMDKLSMYVVETHTISGRNRNG